MLKRRERLSKHDMTTLLKKGRRFHGTHLSLVVCQAAEPRCAVVVGKKTTKKAVERNRIRRAVYHLLGRHAFWRDDSVHCALLLKPSAAHVPAVQLERDLINLASKVRT